MSQEPVDPGGPRITLDAARLGAAVDDLTARDPDLARIVERHGPPPMWDRAPGFPTLIHIILEQQVSLASAQAAFDRLRQAGAPPTPARFLELTYEELLAIGFSRQKARYGRALAAAVQTGTLDLAGLDRLDDRTAQERLVAVPGIGSWTATIYLLMALRRPDLWPAGDIALAQAVADVKGLAVRPGPGEMSALGEAWRPWRSVAARLFWHDYLSRRGRS